MRLSIPTPAGEAIAELDRPANANALVVLTHGAGGGVDTADLLAIRDALVADGTAVARVLQPYRAAGRGAPPKPPVQDPAWLAAVRGVRARRGFGSLPLILVGRSNGARVACRTATAVGAVGVVALAFPLHPPGKPELSRLPELAGAGVPVLVVQGDRDPFGMPPGAPDRVIVTIAKDGHSLKRDPAFVAQTVLTAVRAWR